MYFILLEYIALNYMGANEFKKKKGFSLDFLSLYGFQHQAGMICLFCTAHTLPNVTHGSVQGWLGKPEELMVKSVNLILLTHLLEVMHYH